MMGLLRLIPIPEAWFSEHAEAVDRLSGAGLLAQVLLAVILAPVTEELLYRGLCLSYLRKGFSPKTAVVLQAALFGLFHGTMLQLVYAFAIGLLLGIAALRFKTVKASMIMHVAFNATSCLLPLFLNS